jgi:hypothetical protein
VSGVDGFVIGVDLGQVHDPTAIAIVQRTGDRLDVRHLERRIGEAYPLVVTAIVALASRPELAAPCLVAVDATGVGRPVVDLLRPELDADGIPLCAVTITAGDTPSGTPLDRRVPKRDLIGAVQVPLQLGRLRIAAHLADAGTLVNELAGYQVAYTSTGRDTYANSARETPHDDLVLAVALAVWIADNELARYGGSISTKTARRMPRLRRDSTGRVGSMRHYLMVRPASRAALRPV